MTRRRPLSSARLLRAVVFVVCALAVACAPAPFDLGPGYDSDLTADVVFRFDVTAGSPVRVIVFPTRADVRGELNSVARRHDKRDYVFHTGVQSSELSSLERHAAQTYDRVRNDLRTGAAAGNAPAAAAPDAFGIASDRAGLASEELRQFGSWLYTRLFRDGDAALLNFLESLEGLAAPLNIGIEAPHVRLPWQVLHPVLPPEALAIAGRSRFWGFRYQLTVRLWPSTPLDGGAPGGDRVVFAQAGPGASPGGPPPSDCAQGQSAAPLGSLQLQVTRPTTKAALLGDVAAARGTLILLVASLHANGVSDSPLPRGSDPADRLFFAPRDFVQPEDVDRLRVLGMPGPSGPYLSGRPIVFLNPCDSGQGPSESAFGLGFERTFSRMGARGVVSAEAPVWHAFAQQFGTTLIAHILQNNPVPGALLQTRGQLLDGAGSPHPLGLFYAYYGDPDATMR